MFDFTSDLFWKVMRDIAWLDFWERDIVAESLRECLKAAHKLQLISDDRWMQMPDL